MNDAANTTSFFQTNNFFFNIDRKLRTSFEAEWIEGEAFKIKTFRFPRDVMRRFEMHHLLKPYMCDMHYNKRFEFHKLLINMRTEFSKMEMLKKCKKKKKKTCFD